MAMFYAEAIVPGMVHIPKTARSITATISLIVVLLPSFPTLARADFFLHHWEDHYEPVHSASVEGDFLYYLSNQNYGPQGLLVAAPNSDNYSRQEIDGLVQLGLLDRLSFFGRLTWARVQSNNSIATGTSFGLADQSAGATFRVFEAPKSVGSAS